MEPKYLLISMDDARAKDLSGILGNKTCKMIIDVLVEGEMSEKELAEKLKLPLNTVEYNLKKLLRAEIVEKSSTWFWSAKGKKIPTYKLSNKSIVIAPKNSNLSKLKSIIPAVFVTGVGAFLVKMFSEEKRVLMSTQDMVSQASPSFEKFAEVGTNFAGSQIPTWEWFLFGALTMLVIFVILNWRKL